MHMRYIHTCRPIEYYCQHYLFCIMHAYLVLTVCLVVAEKKSKIKTRLADFTTNK